MSLRRDIRPRALAFALGCVTLGGAALAWYGGGTGPRLADPVAHAKSMRQAEVDARFKQAVVMLHAKQYEHAMTALHRLLELAPEMPEVHVNMGFALLDMKQFPAARDFFLSAIALNVRQVNAYYGLAEAHEGLGELPEAMGAMRTFLHLAPPDDSYRDKARAALWEWETQPRHAADRSQAGAQQPQAGRGEK